MQTYTYMKAYNLPQNITHTIIACGKPIKNFILYQTAGESINGDNY